MRTLSSCALWLGATCKPAARGARCPSALYMLPLLGRFDGAGTIALDRPGFGLSDPADVPKTKFRQAAVDFVVGVMDALGVHDSP
jgi:pimeloyl-ACP methyl ester carboxylesterase